MPALSLKNNESTVDSLRKYFGGELHLKEKIGFMMKRIMFALFDQRKRSRQAECELPQILLREVLVLHQ